MLNFEQRRRKLGLTSVELECKIYNEGMRSSDDRNPYPTVDLRSYCLFAAGVSDR
jgi:hypothetical protein